MGVYGESIDISSPLFRRTVDDETILGQALEMRLDTRRGTYWDDPDYGLQVDDLLNAGLTPDAIVQYSAAIKAECEKDERVVSVAVTPLVEQIEGGGYSLRPDIKVFPNTGGPFSFTGPVSTFTGAALRKTSG